MNSTPDGPRPSTSDDETTEEPSGSAADTSGGLADPEGAEQFRQAVEHRLSEPAPEDADTEKEAADAEPDDDNPVSADNPE
ncbi:hypothetical protein [Kocuria kalidii]|uniref:hypothetical protein n=1 Tax=Kocuria kalidii TaxID=3376283 RepID=UPI0037B3BFFE